MHFGQNSELRPYCYIVNAQNIYIGDNVTIRPGCQLHASSEKSASIIIEDDALLAPNVFITTNNHNYSETSKVIRLQGGTSKSVVIKSGAWLATNVVILPGVTIGKNSVVAAGAVVTKDIPNYVVAAGVPAKIIKYIKKIK